MYRANCDVRSNNTLQETDNKVDYTSDGDSSKENSLVDGHNPQLSTPVSSKTPGSKPLGGSPWGRTLMPRSKHGTPGSDSTLLSNRKAMASNTSLSPSKQSIPWNDISFAAEVLSPGFTDRVVRAAHATSPRINREGRRQYPTAQERYVRAGVMPNVRLGGRTKAVLSPSRTPTSPLIPLSRSSSAFSSALSSDFLSSATPRMPDIRSVASVLEPANSSNECVRDPTSVQAVVAALQQAQAGKGVKRGACYMEAEDLSKRPRCNTPGSSVSSAMPLNYSRDYTDDNQGLTNGCSSNGGGEKRALDLSPTQGSSAQISPENKRRCVLDPMHASLSSSKYLDISRLQVGGRDTPFSMYDSRQDTDSESNRSVDSGRSKTSEQSLHQQTSEATVGDSCIISPGPSERDPSDRSGSHTPQSTRGESWNGIGGGTAAGTANTSRTSTPRNVTPPHLNHIITLDAYKAEKTKSQQRLKKMLGMLFHVNENEETQSSKSGSSTPVPTTKPADTASVSTLPTISASAFVETTTTPATPATTTPATIAKYQVDVSALPLSVSETSTTSDSGSGNAEITASYTFSLKPSSGAQKTAEASDGEAKEPVPKSAEDEGGDVSVSALLKLPSSSAKDGTSAFKFVGGGTEKSNSSVVPSEVEKPSSLVDFLKNTTLPSTTSSTPLSLSSIVSSSPLLLSKLTAPSPAISMPTTPVSDGTVPKFSILPPFSTNGTAGSEPLPTSEKSFIQASNGSVSSSAFSFLSPSKPQNPLTSAFNFGVSSPPSAVASSGTLSSGSQSLPKTSTLPFTFGLNGMEKSSTPTSVATVTTEASVNGNVFTAANPMKMPSFASPVSSSESSTAALSNPMTTSSNLTTQSSPFTFGLPKSTVSTTNTLPTMATTGNSSLSQPNTNAMFTFGTSQAVAIPLTSSSLAPTSTTGMFSFGTSTSTVNGGVALGFGQSAATTSASVKIPSLDAVSTSSASANSQPSATFNFGQPVASHPPTTTSSSGFNFPSSTTQTTGSPAIFQFGMPAQDNKTQISQSSFAPNTANSQSSTMPTSSLFAFGSSGTMPAGTMPAGTTASAAPSLFSFGPQKTDNPPPPYGSTMGTAAKSNTQTGFTFGSTTVATTTAFNSIPSVTTSNAFSSSANTASVPSGGFNFGSPAPTSGFTFGSSNKAPATTTATTAAFTFSSTPAKTPSFGGPTTTTASPFSFGSGAVSSPSFGSNPTQGFGAQTTGATTFGTTTPSFGGGTIGATSPFGSSTTFGVTSPPPPFGAPTFGSTSNGDKAGGATSPFGAQTGSLTFGGPSGDTPAIAAFGTPSSSTPAVATFGNPSSSTPAVATFGTPSSSAPATFGNPSSSTPSLSTFGNPSSSTPSLSTFGTSSTAPAAVGGFGASQTPSFGFGPPSTSTTGNTATSPFQFGQGASNPPAFGAGGATAPGGPVFQFGGGNASPFNAGPLNFGVSPVQGDAQNIFNVGNPGAGAARRPRSRVPRRHR